MPSEMLEICIGLDNHLSRCLFFRRCLTSLLLYKMEVNGILKSSGDHFFKKVRSHLRLLLESVVLLESQIGGPDASSSQRVEINSERPGC